MSIAGVLLESWIIDSKCQAQGNTQLHIDYGISDQEYREQILKVTPLGSKYEAVKFFLLNEWSKENRDAKLAITLGETTLYNELISVGRHQLLEKEPPHISIKDYEHPFNAQGSRIYMASKFYYKPSRWRSEICVGVIYVFDSKKILIDVFATSRPVNHNSFRDL